ncbi:hypothetical protein PsorP6_016081 [Peronosclerospora sorghi]|uniref:Uncharacterized protein n=1 Tax=Peronosclerospora sorghi TaxID=230839 RepID=A0ACC0WN55_9STRA|nr:hypothetical protein PsorP6_016081 [Peronosclerospora sorghi]
MAVGGDGLLSESELQNWEMIEFWQLMRPELESPELRLNKKNLYRHFSKSFFTGMMNSPYVLNQETSGWFHYFKKKIGILSEALIFH